MDKQHSTDLRTHIQSSLNVSPTITPQHEIAMRVDFLADYLLHTGLKGYVLGISGGQDSTLAGRLAQLAAEKVRAQQVNAEFWAVRLPYGTQVDEDDAQTALRFIQPDRSIVINIKEATDAMDDAVAAALGRDDLTDFNRGNVKARQRMIAQYAVAGEYGLAVIGTDHAAENITGDQTPRGCTTPRTRRTRIHLGEGTHRRP